MRFFLLTTLIAIAVSKTQAWNHAQNGDDWIPENDPDYALCGGDAQSPVTLPTYGTCATPAAALTFSSDYQNVPIKFQWTNTKHDAKAEVLDLASTTRTVSYKEETYELEQFHCHHMGPGTTGGSEHVVGDTTSGRYPAECHFVHFNTKYSGVDEAAGENADGLLVVGFFVEFDAKVTPPSTAQWAPTIRKDIVQNYESTEVNKKKSPVDFKFWNDIIIGQGIDLTKFWNYRGSLTTPTCNEAVEWIVMRDPIHLAPALLQALQEMIDGEGNPIINNYRNVQDLNERTIACTA